MHSTVSAAGAAVLSSFFSDDRVIDGTSDALSGTVLAQGVSPRVVMEILGHSQIALTMNTYTHVLPELKKDAAQKMDVLVRDELER